MFLDPNMFKGGQFEVDPNYVPEPQQPVELNPWVGRPTPPSIPYGNDAVDIALPDDWSPPGGWPDQVQGDVPVDFHDEYWTPEGGYGRPGGGGYGSLPISSLPNNQQGDTMPYTPPSGYGDMPTEGLTIDPLMQQLIQKEAARQAQMAATQQMLSGGAPNTYKESGQLLNLPDVGSSLGAGVGGMFGAGASEKSGGAISKLLGNLGDVLGPAQESTMTPKNPLDASDPSMVRKMPNAGVNPGRGGSFQRPDNGFLRPDSDMKVWEAAKKDDNLNTKKPLWWESSNSNY